MKITTMWATSFFFTAVFILMVTLAQKKMVPQKEKWSQFECGFSTMTPSHIPFSFQFFLVALLFLIFDVEIALVLSYPMESASTKNSLLLIVFLLTLTIGLTYEWQKSKISWSK